MKAIDFAQRNVMLAEDQPEYETLPVFVVMQEIIVPNRPNDPKNAIMTKQVPWEMTACFELSDEEIEELLKTRRIWHTQCVFGHNFQPIRMSTKNPFL